MSLQYEYGVTFSDPITFTFANQLVIAGSAVLTITLYLKNGFDRGTLGMVVFTSAMGFLGLFVGPLESHLDFATGVFVLGVFYAMLLLAYSLLHLETRS